jgi:hypothetical protein
MRWINGLSSAEVNRRNQTWHKWYAWYPVKVGETKDGHMIYACFEVVWRRQLEYDGTWEYGKIEEEPYREPK